MANPMFIVPQKAMIKKDGKYLVLKRSESTSVYPGHWDFPGGKLEIGEKLEDCLKRETMEEINLEINPKRIVFGFNDLHIQKVNNYPVVFFVWECEHVSGEPKLSHEHTDFAWMTKNEILELDKIENYLRNIMQSLE